MGYLETDHRASTPEGWHCEQSRLAFRGPPPRLTGPYVVALGGNMTLGRDVEVPFAQLLERRIGRPVANLGIANAGPDVFLQDDGVTALLAGASVAIVELVGAGNLSNRYYSVHPRRNDRFLGATADLRALFPDVDFTEFNFTRHMLSALAAHDTPAFAEVAAHLRETWVSRMAALLGRCPQRRIVVLCETGFPEPDRKSSLGSDPLLVDDLLLDRLAGSAGRVVRLPLASMAAAGRLCPEHGCPDRILDHRVVAEALAPEVDRLLSQGDRRHDEGPA